MLMLYLKLLFIVYNYLKITLHIRMRKDVLLYLISSITLTYRIALHVYIYSK